MGIGYARAAGFWTWPRRSAGPHSRLCWPRSTLWSGGSWRPTLTMFKILPLHQWHTLSDLGAEEMRHRPSLRRFYGCRSRPRSRRSWKCIRSARLVDRSSHEPM